MTQAKKMKTYISIGQLVQDLREAYAAATKARGIANQLVAKAIKRKTNAESKTIVAKKHMLRTCSNWKKIRAELKRYEKQLHDGFTVISYDGVIIGKYIKNTCKFNTMLKKKLSKAIIKEFLPINQKMEIESCY